MKVYSTAQSLNWVQSGLATNPLWSSRLLAEHSSPRHPWPPPPTANWSMMCVVTSGSLFCNMDKQSAQDASTLLERIFWLNEAPNHPCALEDLKCSKPSPSACRPLEGVPSRLRVLSTCLHHGHRHTSPTDWEEWSGGSGGISDLRTEAGSAMRTVCLAPTRLPPTVVSPPPASLGQHQRRTGQNRRECPRS